MRRAGPILILVIGVLALVINFWPGLQIPDPSNADGVWRTVETRLGLDLQGGLRAEYQAQPDARLRAWADFCQMLLASNEFLYIE